MRLFAVVLASIAVLAASVQAYLSWTYLEKLEDRWLHGAVDGQKRVACSRLISATGEYQRQGENLDAYYSAVVQDELARYNRYEVDEDPEALAERAAKAAREAVLGRFRSGARTIFDFIDKDRIYFSEEEVSALGYETYMELPVDMGDFLGRYEASALVNDEEVYTQTLDVIRRIGGLKSDVIQICKPIMLGD